MTFVSDRNPAKSGVYIVEYDDRFGTAYRYFNAESNSWSFLEHSEKEARAKRSMTSKMAFMPWTPVSGDSVVEVGSTEIGKVQATPVAYNREKFGTPAQPKRTVAKRRGKNSTVALVADLAEVVEVAPKPAKVPKVAKAAKTAKAPKTTKASKPTGKAKYEDFTIVPRPDRGGFEGWYGGKAEAFRGTVEQVQKFFTKKYGQAGTVAQ